MRGWGGALLGTILLCSWSHALTLESKDGVVRVDNASFGMTFVSGRNGGFPTEIRFTGSGAFESGFTFEDRLYDGERGFFSPKSDPEAKVSVSEEGPLRGVVTQEFRFIGPNGSNPGGARAVYRWMFAASSPCVDVEARVFRDSDTDFVWPELHFLQISRADQVFQEWAGGDPVTQGRLGPVSLARMFQNWGMLSNGRDALALSMDGGVGFWDGSTEYVTYLQKVDTWSGPERNFKARIYLGPLQSFLEIKRALLCEPILVSASSPSQDLTKIPELSNSDMTLRFSRNCNGSVGWAVLACQGKEWLKGSAEDFRGIWRLSFKGPGLPDLQLSSFKAGPCITVFEGDEGVLSWKGLDLGKESGVVDVAVRIRLSPTGRQILCRISVDNRSQAYGLWEVHFPVLSGLSTSGGCDVAIPRSNWGILYEACSTSQTGSYPSANWPFQMLTLNEGQKGLYVACHDPQAWPKSFTLVPGGEFYFSVWPENAGVPGSDFETPGDVVLAFYEGNWLTGCKMYREWALAEAPWTGKGRLSQRSSTPQRLKDIGLWMLTRGTSDEVVPVLLQAADFFEVPLGVHWYDWHEIPFDTHYPEYFPYKPGFPEGVKTLTDRGIVVMPYINGRLHDMDIPSFEEAEPWCTKDENGKAIKEVYPSGARQAVMCPFTPYWQKRINGVVERLVSECGVNAVYLDQIAAAGPQLCFDPQHGHPLGGGHHWVDGYRDLLKITQEIGHEGDRDVLFTTENNADPYMDGVDAFLIWNPRDPAEIPMMTGVYSGYTLYFSSPVSLAGGEDSFWMAQARDFLWGCQLGWMDPKPMLEEKHKSLAEDFKRLGSYRGACQTFLTYGDLVGELTPSDPLPRVKGRWNGWSDASRDVELPAVKTSVWRSEEGNLGLFFANLSNAPVRFAYDFDPQRFGGMGQGSSGLRLVQILPHERRKAGTLSLSGEHRVESLNPREIRVYEVMREER